MDKVSWFGDFSVSATALIIGTIVVAAIVTITFCKGLWRL